jgi:deoxyribodipyrimidine photolyase
MTAIVWLRHDLRVHDDPALTAALAARDPQQGRAGRVSDSYHAVGAVSRGRRLLLLG